MRFSVSIAWLAVGLAAAGLNGCEDRNMYGSLDKATYRELDEIYVASVRGGELKPGDKDLTRYHKVWCARNGHSPAACQEKVAEYLMVRETLANRKVATDSPGEDITSDY